MHREIEEWIRELCGKGYIVVLFGSRARGEARIDNDWDLLIIGDKPPTEPPNDLAQVHYADELTAEKEIKNFNTIFLDAFYEGKLLCGDTVTFNRLKDLVLKSKSSNCEGMERGQVQYNSHDEYSVHFCFYSFYRSTSALFDLLVCIPWPYISWFSYLAVFGMLLAK
ncbi:MAG: nucleotidyltransferase domain-containing protein [Vulcanisaeta sp.]